MYRMTTVRGRVAGRTSKQSWMDNRDSFVTHMKTLTLLSPCKGKHINILLTGSHANPDWQVVKCVGSASCMHCKKWSHILDIAVIHYILRRREHIPAGCEETHAEQRLHCIATTIAAV